RHQQIEADPSLVPLAPHQKLNGIFMARNYIRLVWSVWVVEKKAMDLVVCLLDAVAYREEKGILVKETWYGARDGLGHGLSQRDKVWWFNEKAWCGLNEFLSIGYKCGYLLKRRKVLVVPGVPKRNLSRNVYTLRIR
ncbi:hypothetical protein Tco_1460607, partial [Tanacetum coccineum]